MSTVSAGAEENFTVLSQPEDNITTVGYFNVETLLLGYNNITITLYDQDGQVSLYLNIETMSI